MGATPSAAVRGESTIDSGFDYDHALEVSQDAVGRELRDHILTDSRGKPIRLSALRGKPLVVSLVYTSCYQICPMTTRHLATVVDKAREALGDDSFSVALIGFDTRVDTPEAMRNFAVTQDIDGDGWLLLSTDDASLPALVEDVGFLYYPSSNGFDHLIQATVIDAEGTVYRQVYGQVFETPQLVEPLIDLVLDRPRENQSLMTTLTDKVRLFCTTYDPARDSYYFDYSLFIGMLIGALIILYTAFVLIRESRARKSD